MADTYSQISSKFVSSSDGELIYAEAIGNPSKPAVVFIPGFMLSVQAFFKQFEDPELQKELYMVRYDPRGHGQSAKPETEEGYSSKLFADDFAAVCKAFGAIKPVLIGWSLAGAIVTDVCTHLGAEAISGAVLIAGVPHLGPILEELISPALLSMIPDIRSEDNVALHKRAMIQFGDTLFFDPASVPFNLKCAWVGASIFMPPVVQGLVLHRTQDPEKFYAALRGGLKIMFMHGDHDAHRPDGMAVVNAIREHLKDYKVVEISNAGHASFYDNVKDTNTALLAFAREVSL